MNHSTLINVPSLLLGLVIASALAAAYLSNAQRRAHDAGYQKRRRQEAALRVTAIRWISRTPSATPAQVISLLTENACELDDDSAVRVTAQPSVAYTDVLGRPVAVAVA